MSPRAANLLTILLALAFAWAAPAACAQDDDYLGPLRSEVDQLLTEGRLHAALVILRAVDTSTLSPGKALALRTEIAELEAKKAKRLAADREQARKLEQQGRFDEADGLLAGIEVYGSPEDMAFVRRERERLLAARQAREAEEAERRAAVERERAQAVAKATATLEKRVKRWLKRRRDLDCSSCKGSGERACKSCEGRGKIARIAGGVVRGRRAPMVWVDCPSCEATGRRSCGDCDATGYNPYRLDDVLWEVWSPEFRRTLEDEVGSDERFYRLLIAERAEGETDAPAIIKACFDIVGEALLPLKRFEIQDIAVEAVEDSGEGGTRFTGRARYRCNYGANAGTETSTWRFAEGEWYLVEPAFEQPDAPPGD